MAMDTYSVRLLNELAFAHGEFWQCWLVPAAIGAGLWSARLHADHTHYVNAATPAMLQTLIEKDDQIAGRRYSPTLAGIVAEEPGYITGAGPRDFSRTAAGDVA
jgi:hypothetical protein